MANMIVEENGWYSCNGVGKCGGTDFRSREAVFTCFHCEECQSYKKSGLKITDNQEKKTLADFF
jgi:hypothetical protein